MAAAMEFFGDLRGFAITAAEADDHGAVVQKLSGQHIWRDEVIEQRFEWGRERGIYAIAVRVFRLPIRLELPNLPEYGGCKSWVTLAKDVQTRDSAPVLDDSAFNARLEQFRTALA